MADKKSTNMEIKKNNRNRVYRYIRESDVTSNPDISYDLKISLPIGSNCILGFSMSHL